MAIAAPHYRCLRSLHRLGQLPHGGAILEIGEANWYGDISFGIVYEEVDAMPEGPCRDSVVRAIDRIRTHPNKLDRYAAVKVLYEVFFRSVQVTSIDFHGTPDAIQRDLNQPLGEAGHFGYWPYSVVINHGTAEHVFNVAQVFKTMHDFCDLGGLMIHESPLTGWVDHGFWSIQPTAYFDLCAANGYKMVHMAVTQIEQNVAIPVESREQLLSMAKHGGLPNNAMLWVAMRKSLEEDFKTPMQGVYAGSVSNTVVDAWHGLR